MLGEAYFKLDRLKEAEHWYREALRAKADHIPAHLTYGKLLTKMVGLIMRTISLIVAWGRNKNRTLSLPSRYQNSIR
jgi:tetratricopeptide (TPR) repeat protein